MTRILFIIAALVSMVTCFTTTQTTSNCNNNNRRRLGLENLSVKFLTIRKQPVLSSSASMTLLFESKESTTTDSTMLDGVVELDDSTGSSSIETKSPPGFVEQAVAPFFSQGEIDPQTLNPDLTDPKQARVIFYIILSLVPVLFLIPLMIGSRDLIPLDVVAPVQL